MFWLPVFLSILRQFCCPQLLSCDWFINCITFFNFSLNPLPNDIFLGLLVLKPCADDKRNVTEKLKFVVRTVEKNIVGKGENAGYQHFSPFHTLFSKGLFFRVAKSQDCVVKG